MKKFNLLLIVSAMTIIFLAACGSQDESNSQTEEGETKGETALTYEPEDINPDTDVCDICAMAVADDQYATQIVLENDRSLKFDDLGCLYKWIEENGEDDIGAKFVRDFHTQEWVQLEDATYVFHEEINTPMAYGVISFKDRSNAEEFIEENELGELLSSDDLSEHKWEMMNHDHDHDEHTH